MKRVKIADILEEFQEGSDFTVESKKRVIFHNEKVVDYLEAAGGKESKWFYDIVRGLFPSVACSYEEKENGNRVFTFKSGNSKKVSNREIEKKFKESTGINITYHGKNSDGEHVISRKFKNPEIEEQKNRLIEESMGKKQVENSEKSLNRRFMDNGDGLTYSTEKVDKDKIIKETYSETRSEPEKKWELEKKEKVDLEQKTQNPEKPLTEKLENKAVGEVNSSQKNEVQISPSNDSSWKSKGLVWGGAGIVGLLGMLVVIKRKI